MQTRYQILQLREPLRLLYELLESYAPVWYTEAHHDKAEAALHLVDREISERRRDAA